MPPDRVRELIEWGRREAAALGEEPAPPLLPPDAVPGFEILAELGRGGMGVVYKALQVSTKRVVALKILLAGCFASRAARKRFQQEVELAARFQHAGIVRILESGMTSAGQQYFAMDYVEGIHLDHWFLSTAADVRLILGLFVEIFEAVEHAHQHGVIHRDLKPANIVVDADGHAHILDFGLSKSTSPTDGEETRSVTVSVPGQVVGTLRYLSPEQAAGPPTTIDGRTDVYTLGVMLYEALTGAPPINTAGSLSDVMQRIQRDLPAPPSSLSDRVDRELETIILKALEKEPSCRYQSVSELRADVKRYLQGEPIQAQPPSRLYVLRKKLRRHRWRISLALVILVLSTVAAFVGAWWSEHTQARREARRFAGARFGVVVAQRLLDQGCVQDAFEKINEIRGRYPDMPEACAVWAKVRLLVARQKGDEGLRDAAIEELKGRLDGGPSAWMFRELLANMNVVVDQRPPPSGEETRVRATPDTAEASYLRSLVTFDVEEALRFAQRAIQRDPQHHLAWSRLAHLYEQTENPDEALQAAQTLLRLGARPLHWMEFQGRILTISGRYAEAVELYNQAIAQFPKLYAPYQSRGVVFLCQQEYAEAIRDFSTAVELARRRHWTNYARATPWWITGQRTRAVEDYRRVLKLRGQVTCADARLFLVLSDEARHLDGAGLGGEAEKVRAEAAEVLQRALHEVMPSTRTSEILKCLAGKIEPEALVGSADPANLEHVCESSYYAGEACLLQGRFDQARRFFRQCVGTGLMVDPNSERLDAMNEYHLARWRLRSFSGI